jgi:DNA-binding transcriptional ArsR family regulator
MEVYNVSKHLRILKEAGLVEVEKQGQQRIYRLSSGIECKINPTDETMDLGCCRFSMDRVSGEGGQ